MTRDELISKFQGYIGIVTISESLLRERNVLRMKIEDVKSSMRLDGMPRSFNKAEGDAQLPNVLEKMDNLMPKIVKALSQSVERRIEIEDYISLISDPRKEAVIRLKYCEQLTMEEVSNKIRTIPGETNYCKKQCWRFHNAAIDEILEKLNNVPKCPS